ncbi:RNA polymerase sigma factor [Paenibacillus sp. TRM 82003]|nr:RNA polymerase sigma factor [Paenibacillus sp. TRM 82003]
MFLKPSAVEDAYSRYHASLYNFLLRLTGNAHDAADLLHDTFLRYAQRGEQAKEISWFYKTSYRLFIDHWRRRRRWKLPGDELAEPQTKNVREIPELAYEERELYDAFYASLQSLPPRARAALLLRERESASYSEIAEALGTSENAVKTLLYRARVTLRKKLFDEPQGGTAP